MIGFYLENLNVGKHEPGYNEKLFIELHECEDAGEHRSFIVEELIKNNVRLITHLMGKKLGDISNLCQTRRMTKDDIFSVGLFGLHKSIDTFDVTKGYKFATYASMVISNELNMMLRNSKKTENDTSVYKEVRAGHSSTPMSLIDVLEDGTDYIGRVVESDTYSTLISKLDTHLSKTEKYALMKYFIDELTQKQISEDLGMSSANVSKILKRALGKARTVYEKEIS